MSRVLVLRTVRQPACKWRGLKAPEWCYLRAAGHLGALATAAIGSRPVGPSPTECPRRTCRSGCPARAFAMTPTLRPPGLAPDRLMINCLSAAGLSALPLIHISVCSRLTSWVPWCLGACSCHGCPPRPDNNHKTSLV